MQQTLARIILATALGALAIGPAAGAGPLYDDILPLSQVRAGMKGYGLTTFRGTRIDRFEVTVVSVVKKGNLFFPGHDAILVRMSGGPLTERNANLIQGMSGSPIYVDGKIIGAFSMGEESTREPLGYATPIEDMLEAWDPKLPKDPLAYEPHPGVKTVDLPEPVRAGGRTIRHIVANVPISSPLRSHGDLLVLHPCTTFAYVAGASAAAREKLAKALAPYNVELAQTPGGGQMPGFKGRPLVPGAAVGIMLVTGDFSLGATGTVTYRRGNKILCLGHPFMGLGAIDAPITSAYIHDIQPRLSVSHVISSPGPVVGTSLQDRNFGVSGVVGTFPKMIPIAVEVKDLTTGRKGSYHSEAVIHPSLSAAAISATVGSAIADIRSTPGAAMARVTTTVDADEIGKVSRTNRVFDMRAIDAAATADLDDMVGMLASNPFYPLGVKSADVKVEIESGHQTAQVERVYVKEGRFEPGESAEVGVVIKPYKLPAVTKTVKITIPPNTPSGRYILQVRGGAVPAGISFGGVMIRPPSGGSDQAPPVSVRQMMTRLLEREKNNEVVIRILLPSTAVNVEGERLSNLPPSIDAIMRSAKSSGVRLERDEVKLVEPTDWVISGQQLLAINVQKREQRESPSAAGSSGAAPIVIPSGQPGGVGASLFRGADRDDEEADYPSPALTANSLSQAMGEGAYPLQQRGRGSRDARGERARSEGGQGQRSDPAKPEAGGPPVSKPATEVPAPAATAESSSAEKPVARAATVWRQTSRADFAGGSGSGVAVTTRGDLRLARTLKKVATSPESFLWSLVTDGRGGLYGGTGTPAKVLHIEPGAEPSVVAKLPDVSVQAVLAAPDGTVWAATAPEGRTYRIGPDGKTVVAHTALEKYALALARDSKGNVYVGTGGGHGTVYRIAPDGQSSPLFRTSEQHVQALAVDAQDNIYVGTSAEGVVYKITPGGKATVLYAVPEQSVTSLAVGPNGAVYAGTAPRGVIYRIQPEGTAKAVFEKAPSAITALRTAPDGTVYAAAGSSIYTVNGDDTVVPIENRLDIDVLSLAVAADGTVYAGTGNSAEVYAAPPMASVRAGTYESVIHDAKLPARWGAIRWTAATPTGTKVEIQTRSGNAAEPDGTWSGWDTPDPTTEGGRVRSPQARFIQYRVRLTSDRPDASPTLRDIAISYLAKNQAPTVAFSAPSGGERWSGKQNIRWTGTDPDKDTLSYELYYSADSGAHWLPLPASGPTNSTPAPASPQPAKTTASRPPSVADVTAELDKHPDLPRALRDEVIERTRKLNAQFDTQNQGSGAPAAVATAGRETSRSLDTHQLPDGGYLLRVVASDRPSNGVDAQTAEAVSESFVICNSAPSVIMVEHETKISADGSANLAGVAMQRLIAVTAVQFRVDGGEWLAAVPDDGIFDGPLESFHVVTAALAKGSHSVEIKAFNAANGAATEKVTVEVK